MTTPKEGICSAIKTAPPGSRTIGLSDYTVIPSHKEGETETVNALAEAGRADAELVARTITGENEAFEVLVERYRPLVRVVVARVLRGHDAVEDLIQDTFIRAFTNIANLDQPSRFRSWLLQIAANRARDYIRHISRRERVVEDSTLIRAVESGLVSGLGASAYQSAVNNAADVEAERKELRERIEKAIHELPLGYHKLATMRYLEGASYDEIAERLKLPEKTILKRARRTRAILRQKLRKDHPGEA